MRWQQICEYSLMPQKSYSSPARQVYATNSIAQVDEQRHKHAVIYASIATLIASAATTTKKGGKLCVTEM